MDPKRRCSNAHTPRRIRARRWTDLAAVGARLACVLLAAVVVACSNSSGGGSTAVASGAVESCMQCHNASLENDYAGPGMENPHPFAGAASIKCTTCHGGNPKGADKVASHVPAPPEIGDDANLIEDRTAYFNRLTLTGLDKLPNYKVGKKTYKALDYLQFVNPGDLRVVSQGKSCGMCHANHVDNVEASLLATSAGILSGAMYAIGADNAVPESQGLYEDTAADLGFRGLVDNSFQPDPGTVGAIARLLEFPVFSRFGGEEPTDIFQNDLYDAEDLFQDVEADMQVVTNSPLANLYHEQVAFTCGDCHLGSAGANNRYGDFRSSGCTACHMPYSQSGRYGGMDPNVNKVEPFDVDDIEAPERAHVASHRIVSIAQTLPSGEFQQGINDYACAGCHQGSNRTVMQYWGIRLDQNEDVKKGFQYPAQPVSYQDTKNDTRLFDPVVDNKTFNGRDDDQYLLFEDYDGDGRDDTPADVHYEAGLGCIDCHGSFDLHGGDVSQGGTSIYSRMEHGTAISCESCHGGVDAYAATQVGVAYDGRTVELAIDDEGLTLPHVVKEDDGHYYLTSRLTGDVHFVPQTRDTVADSGKTNPLTGATLYSSKASYAMGRADGDPATGTGPQQLASGGPTGFSHTDNMDCASCHASWTNTCAGCHLEGEYNTNPNNHSNITGERIVFRERNADFVYQSPLPFQLGVNADNKITQMSSNTKMFFKYRDRQGDFSDVFAFSDRNGGGNGAAAFPSLSHNAMMAHSIRGEVDVDDEGPRYCVACHLTDDGLDSFGRPQYDAFRAALAAGDFGALDFTMLQQHIGRNPGNRLDSPVWVHMVAGLGSGLFLFDEDGCPINPLDANADRAGCNDVAPASVPFDPSRVAFDLDRIVEANGVSTGSNNHALMEPGQGPNLRDGATNPNLSGPLGATLIERLADPDNGVVLDSWLDADGTPQGGASTWVDDP